jgi:hypothetical protein
MNTLHISNTWYNEHNTNAFLIQITKRKKFSFTLKSDQQQTNDKSTPSATHLHPL